MSLSKFLFSDDGPFRPDLINSTDDDDFGDDDELDLQDEFIEDELTNRLNEHVMSNQEECALFENTVSMEQG